jgi:hypothetical protein
MRAPARGSRPVEGNAASRWVEREVLVPSTVVCERALDRARDEPSAVPAPDPGAAVAGGAWVEAVVGWAAVEDVEA